jgi:archaeoflavoprotein AfpA
MNSTEQKNESDTPTLVKLAWGLAGAGDLLPETFEIMKKLNEKGNIKITAILSQAAVKVLKMYKLWDALPTIVHKVRVEQDANTPFVVGSLQLGKFDALLVAPTTGNSVAKIVHGISDSLLTNVVSMTNRTKVPIFILPVEKKGKVVVTTLPDGNKLELLTRDLDADNTEKLQKMKGITVLEEPKEILKIIEQV